MAKKRFNYVWLVAASVLVIALAGACGVMFLLGDSHGVQTMQVTRITPTQAARAMEQDDFFGSYRERVLIVSGTVADVSQSGGADIVTFVTSTPSYHAYCRMAAGSMAPMVGQALTVVTMGGPASRVPDGVLMVDCTAL
jgi:hypothetical protein